MIRYAMTMNHQVQENLATAAIVSRSPVKSTLSGHWTATAPDHFGPRQAKEDIGTSPKISLRSPSNRLKATPLLRAALPICEQEAAHRFVFSGTEASAVRRSRAFRDCTNCVSPRLFATGVANWASTIGIR